jgi:hypothetical protein
MAQGDSTREDFNETAQARTPGRDIFGPLDDHLPEVRIPADVKLDATRAAAAAGLDLTAWIRELVYSSVYGPEHLASLYEKRARRVLGNAPQQPRPDTFIEVRPGQP